MGRRWQCDWQHSEEELFHAYRQAVTARMLPRRHALWQRRRGCSLTEVAALIGVTYRPVHTWVAWYRQGGLAEVTRHQQGAGAPDRRATPGVEIAGGYGGVSDAMGRDHMAS